MGYQARHYPHTKRAKPDGPWFAYLAIPAQLQTAFGGNKFFQQSTHETNRARAFAIAQPLVAGWRKRLVEARQTTHDPVRAKLDTIAARVLEAIQNGDPLKAKMILSDEGLDEAFRLGRGAALQDQAMIAAEGNANVALRSLPEAAKAVAAIEVMAHKATPFLTYLDGWKADTRLRDGQLKTAIKHIERFAGEVPESVESLQSFHVQLWVNDALRKGDAPNTVANRKINVKGYWDWMVSTGKVPQGLANPFSGVKVIDRRTPAERVKAKILAYPPADAVRLLAAADADEGMRVAIRLAMFTGIRREVVCTLNRRDIHLTANIPFIHVDDDKTEAGVRDVPIHPEILELVRQLVRNADPEGYLIHSTAADRADAIGKKFSKLKTRLGYDGQHNFHSLRKSFIRLMVQGKVALHIVKGIVGHEDDDMTTGDYHGECTMEEKLEAMAVVRYPLS